MLFYSCKLKNKDARLNLIQTIQHRLAEVKTETAVMRSFVDAAMVLQTKEELDYTTASMAKYWVSEKAHMNISKLLQLFGGWGYMWEYPIARAYADSRAGFYIKYD